ncbi:hypothetical protein J4228_03795 [Candidatus Woesearchaeota archaeon]|nr:hypothetical protein [Candidatus Woesearchaeota archaeon]
MDTKDLQQRQAEYDAKYWQHNASELEKIRHITLHVGKLVGKLATYCERQEHGDNYSTDQIRDEVVPDLVVYASQLANLLGIEDVGDKYLNRLEENVKRLHSEK